MDIKELEKNGELFEGWSITRFIGEGGFGKVYEIEREEYGVKLNSALKHIQIPKSKGDVDELMSEGMDEASASAYFRGYVEEFARECAIMSKLKGNSHIVSFEDYKIIENKNTIGWDILIRMEMLTPLIDYMKTNPLTKDEVIKLGVSMCEALELCKKQNIIHRDIKPANIFLSANGDYKLGDFGISRIVEQSNGASTKVGTNDYMAPEVFKGQKYDSTVDIYSLGLVLYRLLNNNRLPFLPPAPEAITHSHRENAVAKRMQGAEIPKPANADNKLFDIIKKACAYNPAERYLEPSYMKAELLKLINGDTGDIKEEEKPVVNIPADTIEDDETVARTIARPIKQPEITDTPPVPEVIPNEDKKKKSKAPLIIGLAAGAVVLIALIAVIASVASSGKSNTQTTSKSTATAKPSTQSSKATSKPTEATGTESTESTKSTSTGATEQGTIYFDSEYVLAGDSVNARFEAGDWIIGYAADLSYESSDTGVATISASSDKQRYAINGKNAGTAVITATYGDYTGQRTINVVEEDAYKSAGDIYGEMLDGGMIADDGGNINGKTLEIPQYGSASLDFDFELFNFLDNLGTIYCYTSEDMDLNISGSWSGTALSLTVKDATLYEAKGELTILIMNSAGDAAIAYLHIPVEIG